MGSIDLHQSAGLCAQPEAAQDNPYNLQLYQNNGAMLCLPDPFFPHPHRKEKKQSGYARLLQHYKGLEHFVNQNPQWLGV